MLGLSVQAQQLSSTLISPLGSNHGQLSYTLGDLIIQTRISGSFILTQGFQQTEASGESTSSESSALKVGFEVYPNPAINEIFLQLNTAENLSLYVSVSDLQGKILLNSVEIRTAETRESVFDISSLEAGYYLMIIKDREGKVYQNVRFLKIMK
jgi:hypothetical protein